MSQSIMTYIKSQSHRIDFSVRISGNDLIEQLAFIYLVSMRHDGEININKRRFKRGDGKVFKLISVQYKDFSSASDAMSHCNGHLDDDGCVNSTYVGALQRADPGLRTARGMYEEVTGQPAPN